MLPNILIALSNFSLVILACFKLNAHVQEEDLLLGK